MCEEDNRLVWDSKLLSIRYLSQKCRKNTSKTYYASVSRHFDIGTADGAKSKESEVSRRRVERDERLSRQNARACVLSIE